MLDEQLNGLENSRKNEPKSIGELANELMTNLKDNVSRKQFIPQADVWESEGAYYISVYLPGVKRANVKMDVNNGYLVISGERNVQAYVSEHKIRLMESAYGLFQRRIKLNQRADTQNIKAKLELGILNIIIPKKQQQDFIQNIKVA